MVIRRTLVLAAFVAAVALANHLDLGAELPAIATRPARATAEPPPNPPPPPVAPLTGLTADAAATRRPALAVKIDGAPPAHPQVGLDQADVVYEEPVEGITRYVAVFHSHDPGVVGPIRSVRPMDPFIVDPLDGVLAISGGIPAFVGAARGSAEVFEEGSPGYFRDRDRPAPHNLMARAGDVWGAARAAAPPAPLFPFRGDDDAPPGEPATGLSATFPGGVRAEYAWDPGAGGWARSVNGRPHVAASGARIVATNVVVQRVALRATRFTGPGGGRVNEAVVVGGGEVLVFSEGRVVAGTWERPDPAGRTRFLGADGAEILLAPGPTWVELVPVSGTVAVARPAPAPAPPAPAAPS